MISFIFRRMELKDDMINFLLSFEVHYNEGRQYFERRNFSSWSFNNRLTSILPMKPKEWFIDDLEPKTNRFETNDITFSDLKIYKKDLSRHARVLCWLILVTLKLKILVKSKTACRKRCIKEILVSQRFRN